MPVNVTVVALSSALLVITVLASRLPSAVGVNVMATVADPPARECPCPAPAHPQLSGIGASEEDFSPIVSGAPPVFVTVTLRVALATPTATAR